MQRALWGEQPEDVRLAALLLDARIAFEVLCGTWPEVFMAQAHAELQQVPAAAAWFDPPASSDGRRRR